jgi:hypothetical protein
MQGAGRADVSGGSQTIVPRWELRAFAGRLGDAAARLEALAPDRVHESDDLYLLSLEGEDTVKVRDGLMDVKHLEEVDDRGLERWRPVMKAGFPLEAADVRVVWTALSVAAPPLERPAYTLDQLLGEVVDPATVRPMSVHKRRRSYSVGGCAVELADVRAERTQTRTIAVESEDPARAMAVARDLGLEARPNTSYPRGLRGLTGFGGRRRSDRRRHQLRKAPRRRTLPRRHVALHPRPRRDHAARRGPARERRPRPGADDADDRGDLRHGPRRATGRGGSTSRRSARPRCAGRRTAPRSSRPCGAAAACASRSSPARRRAG